MADDKPIIIIKKSHGAHGHHGGAWKVAYADFVTAMMAFFMVMWLVNSADITTKQNIALYFRKPGIFESGSGTPMFSGGSGILPEGYVPPHPESSNYTFGRSQDPRTGRSDQEGGADPQMKTVERDGEAGIQKSDDPAQEGQFGGKGDFVKGAWDAQFLEMQRQEFKKLAEELQKEMVSTPDLQQLLGIVDVKVDADGLNIEIIDTEKSSMFSVGSARIQPEAQQAFSKLGTLIKDLPNNIDIVGHTDARPFGSRNGGYSNWELSADRANAARRLLEAQGIAPARITSVVGRADKELKDKDDPLSPMNRRITLKMRFRQPDATALTPGAVSSFKDKEQRFREEQEKVHSFTAKEMLEGRPAGTIGPRAPSEEGTARPVLEPTPFKDKIFGNTPVIGPRDPFEGF
ncbi:MAG: flagellar motor protein MotB [Bdellovibrionota bacterium]|nr:MAG: flagellar motor protein MotB [Bdellovibrionota bacterium]